MNRRGLKVQPDPERARILPRVFAIAGKDACRPAQIVRGNLLRVDSTDTEAVDELIDLYNRALRGEDVLRENPQLRIFPIDEHPF